MSGDVNVEKYLEVTAKEDRWVERLIEMAAVQKTKVMVRVKLLRPTAQAPRYMTAGAAGADVFADLDGAAFFIVQPRTTAKVRLGVALEIPDGWVGILKGRSGLAAKGHEVHVAAVDADYRGEVCMLVHAGDEPLRIGHGDRVGQILFVPAPQARIEVVDELSETARGAGGFGHTGVR